MARILTITANPLLDFLAEIALTPGKIHRIPNFQPTAGGKGINVARVLARHGHEVLAGGFLGGSSGGIIRDILHQQGVTPVFTAVSSPTRIGFQAIAGPATTALMEQGSPLARADLDRLLADCARHLAGCDLLIIGGSAPAGGEDLYAELATLAARDGVPCWLDAYGEAQRRTLGGEHPPALVKPNRQEFTGDPAWQRVPEIHLTDGGAAIHITHAGKSVRVEPPRIAEVNPVGSGDCYLAGLAHGRLSGWPIEDQWRYAAAAGAANALRSDVAEIMPDEILRLLPQVTVAPR